MTVTHHIDGHAVDIIGKVAAVVQIKTPQKILIRLAVTAVLGHHHTRYGF